MQTKGDRPQRADFCTTPVSQRRQQPPDLFSDREVSDLDHHMDTRSPLPSLVFSNINSPLLAKRAQIGSGSKGVSPKSPFERGRASFRPRFSPRATARLSNPAQFTWPAPPVFDRHSEENASGPFSRVFCAESTAIGSRERDGEGLTFRCAPPFELEDEDELERGGFSPVEDRLRLAVSELIKMRPAFELLKRFYEGSCGEPGFLEGFLAMAHEFELEILQALFAYLQLVPKTEPLPTFSARLPLITSHLPNRKKKKAKMIQMIFVQAFCFLRNDFNAGKARPMEKEKRDVAFFVHYFGGQEGGLAAFDYAQNLNNGNLSYKFYERVFASRTFANDFVAYLRSSFLFHYQEVRRRKLKAIFSRWEKHFLDFIDEKEAVRLVLKEIASPRFKFVFHNSELQKYFRFFEHYAGK